MDEERPVEEAQDTPQQPGEEPAIESGAQDDQPAKVESTEGEPVTEFSGEAETPAAEAGDAAEAQRLLSLTQKRVDMAVTKGVLHESTGSRRKSRLSSRVNSLLA